MALLDSINSPADVKRLPEAELPTLCEELRRFLIERISQSGGHLASNLGVVELTVAIHRVFDTSKDRLVFDVGHQCYTHKILTGRKDGFQSPDSEERPGFRRLGGVAGFPKPSESVHDAFAAGHASTAVSAALGMARARTLLGDGYSCLAFLGDGALTGGMAYEALSDAGQSVEPLIVLLNDNEMSITRNVGGMARHLARLRLKPQYFAAKKVYHRLLAPLPGGKKLDAFLRRVKTAVKDAMLPGSMFEGMGFVYLGPVNGHDLRAVTEALERAKALQKPVIVHLTTVKGKGYRFAEQDPSRFHGVSAFDRRTGNPAPPPEKLSASEGNTFAGAFGHELAKLAENNPLITAITAAMRSSVGLDEFAARYPSRFFDVAIAEGHAVTMAAGLCKQGLRPVCAIYSTFLQRAYDQIVHDVALQKLPVVFLVDRAGLVGEDGETHHGVFDPGFLCGIPHMGVYTPASHAELRAHLRLALCADGPVAIRTPRGGEGAYTQCHPGVVRLREGRDATLLTYGTMINVALEAARLLARRGVSAGVVKTDRIKPLSYDDIAPLVSGPLTVLEDNTGVLGTLCAAARSGETLCLNTGDRFVPHGTVEELLAHCGLDASAVAVRMWERFPLERPRLSQVSS